MRGTLCLHQKSSLLSPLNKATQWEKVHLKELEVKIEVCLCGTFVHDAVSWGELWPESLGIKKASSLGTSRQAIASSLNHSPDHQLNEYM